jgi:hypothetical protein
MFASCRDIGPGYLVNMGSGNDNYEKVTRKLDLF